MKLCVLFAALIFCQLTAFPQSVPELQQRQTAPPPATVAPSANQQQDAASSTQQQQLPEAQSSDRQSQPLPSQPAGAVPQAQSSDPNYDQHSIRGPGPRHVLQASPAVRPRPEADAYPVSRDLGQFSIGARLLSSKEVEQKFSTPLGKHYLVVEVAIYPPDGKTVKLRAESFTLRAGNDDQAFFPALPEDIARNLAKSGAHPNPRIFPTLGVGYDNGPWGRGVSTGVGVGVGSGPYPRPVGAGDSSARVMESELRDKSLPEGDQTGPSAGYLYFPLEGKRLPHYNLELTRNTEIVSLPLPEPKK